MFIIMLTYGVGYLLYHLVVKIVIPTAKQHVSVVIMYGYSGTSVVAFLFFACTLFVVKRSVLLFVISVLFCFFFPSFDLIFHLFRKTKKKDGHSFTDRYG